MSPITRPAGPRSPLPSGVIPADAERSVAVRPVDARPRPGGGPPERPGFGGGPPEQARAPVPHLQQALTMLILFGPLAGIAAAATSFYDRGVTALDLVLCAAFWAVSGHGITAGYHRMLTHRAFKAARWAKIALVVAGSLGFQGGVNGWVANHRRHHAYTDREGDPHSPYAYGTAPWARTRGLLHAHVGWLFQSQSADEARWAPDVSRDRDLVVLSRLFPLFCFASLGMPTAIGWALTGTLAGAVGGFIWGGLVRVFVLQQGTFAVNSACHIWGKRPYATRDGDRATNFAPLLVLSMGDNWHNVHHCNPSLARMGVDRGQLDSTARLIWALERIGAVSDVHWPVRATLDARRRQTVPDLRL